MVAYAYDELFLAHQPRSAHPERPARALAVMEALGAAGLAARGRAGPVRPASDDEILRVHPPGAPAVRAPARPPARPRPPRGAGAAPGAGGGEGAGATVNVPLPAGSGDAEYA